MKPLSSHTANDKLKLVYSKIMPRWVSYNPNCRYIRKMGTVTTTAGSIRWLNIKKRRSSFPGTGKRLKAYAASTANSTDSTVEVPAMISEFKSCPANWLCPMMVCWRCNTICSAQLRSVRWRYSANSAGESCRRWVNKLTKPSSVGVKNTFGGTETASGSG